MEKYIVTEKHQLIKNGLIIAKYSDALGHFFLANTNINFNFTQDIISKWVAAGWLIECDTKEFTRDEMIRFADYRLSKKRSPMIVKDLLALWIKENKK